MWSIAQKARRPQAREWNFVQKRLHWRMLFFTVGTWLACRIVKWPVFGKVREWTWESQPAWTHESAEISHPINEICNTHILLLLRSGVVESACHLPQTTFAGQIRKSDTEMDHYWAGVVALLVVATWGKDVCNRKQTQIKPNIWIPGTSFVLDYFESWITQNCTLFLFFR